MGGITTADLISQAKGVELHGKSLRIVFTYKSVRCRESLGLAPTKANIKYASGLRSTVLHEISTGTFDYQHRFPESKNATKFGRAGSIKHISLEQLSISYLKVKSSDLATQTVRRYKVALEQCLNILESSRLVSSLLPEDILQLRSELICTRSTSTANHYLAALSGMLSFAFDNGYSEHKLFKSCKKFKVGKIEPYPLELGEYKQLLKAGCQHQTHSNLITVAVYTGLRTGELRALAWEDIDLEKGIIMVRRNIAKDSEGYLFKLPKTDEKRTVILLPPAIAALTNQMSYTAGLPRERVQVFIDKKRQESMSVRPVFRPTSALPHYENHPARESVWYGELSLSVLWRKILKRAGVNHRRIYQTRHTYACWQLTAHGNIAFIAEQMGHSDYSMLVKTYGRWMATESSKESIRIWLEMEKLGHNAPNTPQNLLSFTESTDINGNKRPNQTHPDDAAIPANQTAASGAPRVLSYGRFLRTVLRGCKNSSPTP